MKAVAVLLCLLFISPSRAQDTVKTWKVAMVAGTTAGLVFGGNILNNTLWWKGEKSAFHTEWNNDWHYALGADKFGHFYFPYLAAYPLSESFQWCGYSRSQSLWLACGTSLAYQTYIEVRDGFSKEWGFSWGDFAADVLGAGYPLVQEHYPAFKNIEMKISFFPSNRFKNNSHKVIFDDYESTVHWISLKPSVFLPESAAQIFPAWLNFAIGHSVQNLDSPTRKDFELYLSLDADLKHFAPDNFLGKVLRFINYYHLPAPAVRVYPNVVWYGVKF